ncbi:MAG: hypothetical protein KBT54_12805, partial [Amphritea sp.]|nr:hypothetical protein [Amphritea sp.]
KKRGHKAPKQRDPLGPVLDKKQLNHSNSKCKLQWNCRGHRASQFQTGPIVQESIKRYSILH